MLEGSNAKTEIVRGSSSPFPCCQIAHDDRFAAYYYGYTKHYYQTS